MNTPQLINQFNETAPTSVRSAIKAPQRLGQGFAIFMLVLFVVATLVFYFVHTSQLEVAEDDFFIEWKGAQVALQGGDPYSDSTTRLIQIGLHRFNVTAGQDQLAFVYPYWRVFYNAPLNLLPYAWAAAVWLGLRLTLLFGSIFLVCRTLGWQLRTVQQQVAVYLSLLLAFPTFAALMEGQIALLSGSLIVLTYYCLRTGAQSWAGIWLALATVKPQLAAILCLLLVGRAIWRREWRFMISFLLALTVLTGTSFLAYPNWLGEFLTSINRYPGYKKSLTGPGFIFEGLGGVGTILTMLVWLVIASVGLFLWWRGTTKNRLLITQGELPGSFFDLIFCVGIALTLLLPPQTNIVNALLLEVPVLLLMERWSKTGQHWRFYTMAFGNVVVSWGLYFALYNDFYGWLIVAPTIIVGLLFMFTFKDEFLALVREPKGRINAT